MVFIHLINNINSINDYKLKANFLSNYNSFLKFWGLEYKKIYEQKIINNKKRPIGPQFASIILSDEIRPEWIEKNEKIPIFFPNIYENVSKGKILVEFFINEKRMPAVVLEEDKIIFNFDPEETVRFLMLEKYFIRSRPFFTKLPIHPHYLPGVLRTAINNALFFVKKKEKVEFPSWPIEKSIETIRWIFLRCFEIMNSKKIKPKFWPKNKKYAIALTHDVETGEGFKRIKMLSDPEEKHGLFSCWNFLSNHYRMDYHKIDELIKNGHEIGSHGFNHDGKLPFLNKEKMEIRLDNCSGLIKKYNIKGFRSPFLLRTDEMFDAISKRFFYDLSIPDTERESQVGMFNGCCTVFPFMINGMVELPITLPQDSRLLSTGFKGEKILDLWMKKLEWIKAVGGVAVLNTHPEKHLSGNKKMSEVYEKFLKKISIDDDAWIAKPYEIAEWWKQR